MNANHLLVTGGAGFIGANLVRYLRREHPQTRVSVVDKLTYAGNRRYLEELIARHEVPLIVADIADREAMEGLFARSDFDGVIHLAAESHVDRSIRGPADFVQTNVVGSFVLLESARRAWEERGIRGRFLHVSTDEVYGSLGPRGAFSERTPYDPSSPYSATKASSDHLARAYHRTYGMDVVITNCSNNFGPFQYPEKLIPVIIRRLRDGQEVPVYGDGRHVRDWLFVEDHCRALSMAFAQGESGRSYNVGAHNEWTNLDLVYALGDLVDRRMGRPAGTARQMVSFVQDRPGHDRRYAIDATRIRSELGWEPRWSFEEALAHTVDWYLRHMERIWPGGGGLSAGRRV
ncbi:dTDP-glucose 4,6-dehydratase [Lujinxingia sediminis]|uniref:dTDP-glucose 4,6-dehydratase n=1 Tax=Lujinxingia sediminis TaxID=2480984 RepID=A0ABY0CP87_9DELT|nr:dTDP-glucose 4,6-dehydratase [Lujinxingia sediminis]RVU42146.1 dTDP-glucose 4,6-dehydratase [Lujinxingia sediminis]